MLSSHLDTSWGLISLNWLTWSKVFDVKRHETHDDSKEISEDVSKNISKYICASIHQSKYIKVEVIRSNKWINKVFVLESALSRVVTIMQLMLLY